MVWYGMVVGVSIKDRVRLGKGGKQKGGKTAGVSTTKNRKNDLSTTAASHIPWGNCLSSDVKHLLPSDSTERGSLFFIADNLQV
jgi:hypothetical protein